MQKRTASGYYYDQCHFHITNNNNFNNEEIHSEGNNDMMRE